MGEGKGGGTVKNRGCKKHRGEEGGRETVWRGGPEEKEEKEGGKKKKKKRIGDIFFWFTCPQRIGTGKTCASCIS